MFELKEKGTRLYLMRKHALKANYGYVYATKKAYQVGKQMYDLEDFNFKAWKYVPFCGVYLCF